MSKDEVDSKKRKFLRRATTTLGAAGVVAAAYPFVDSMLPSAEVEAAGGPVSVKLKDMKPGDQLTVIWRSKPIWIVRRTAEAIAGLAAIAPLLRDPDSKIKQQPSYAQNLYRSRNPEFLVLVAVCTHLGCAPTYRPDRGGIDKDWPGGFYCSCHGSKFDLAGRVYNGVPAPINLEVPPYVFLSDDEIMIGVNEKPKPA